MKAVRQKDTTPELVVRRLLHSLGYRYRLHAKELQGRPNLVFPSRRKVVFVHGCFWHGHNCRKNLTPRTHEGFWMQKITHNRVRDLKNEEAVRARGWDVLTVWECDTTSRRNANLERDLRAFLGPPKMKHSLPRSINFLADSRIEFGQGAAQQPRRGRRSVDRSKPVPRRSKDGGQHGNHGHSKGAR